jgi:hypothetical protein
VQIRGCGQNPVAQGDHIRLVSHIEHEFNLETTGGNLYRWIEEEKWKPSSITCWRRRDQTVPPCLSQFTELTLRPISAPILMIFRGGSEVLSTQQCFIPLFYHLGGSPDAAYQLIGQISQHSGAGGVHFTCQYALPDTSALCHYDDLSGNVVRDNKRTILDLIGDVKIQKSPALHINSYVYRLQQPKETQAQFRATCANELRKSFEIYVGSPLSNGHHALSFRREGFIPMTSDSILPNNGSWEFEHLASGPPTTERMEITPTFGNHHKTVEHAMEGLATGESPLIKQVSNPRRNSIPSQPSLSSALPSLGTISPAGFRSLVSSPTLPIGLKMSTTGGIGVTASFPGQSAVSPDTMVDCRCGRKGAYIKENDHYITQCDLCFEWAHIHCIKGGGGVFLPGHSFYVKARSFTCSTCDPLLNLPSGKWDRRSKMKPQLVINSICSALSSSSLRPGVGFLAKLDKFFYPVRLLYPTKPGSNESPYHVEWWRGNAYELSLTEPPSSLVSYKNLMDPCYGQYKRRKNVRVRAYPHE